MEDYWSQHPLLGAPGISRGMPIRRFKALQSCLHLNDNTTARKRGEPGYDKLHKIRPVMKSIRENCQRCYRLHREVSVDEAMVGFKGRSFMKQYCPMKPTKRGYKVWVLSDAHTGYMYNFAVYCGAMPGVTEHGLGASVVRKKTRKQHLKRGDHRSTNCFPWCPVLHVNGQESCTIHQYHLQSIQSNNSEA